MNTELSYDSFIRICAHISERHFRRPFDVFGLLLESFTDQFISDLDRLWFDVRHPGRPYSPSVTVAGLQAMRALVGHYAANTSGDYQAELQSFEREAEALRDRFAEKFNDPTAVGFETDLQNLARAAAQEGYELAPKVRGAGMWSTRPPFEKALVAAGFQLERDTAPYEALFTFFEPHFKKGFDEPFPPHLARDFEQARNERDPSLN